MLSSAKSPHHQQYQSYLLRLWNNGATSEWRASLVDAATREERSFATLELLVDYLYRQVRHPAENVSKDLADGKDENFTPSTDKFLVRE